MPRRRYVYDEKLRQLVEIDSDWRPTPRTELMTGNCYDDARTVEGVDISSRRKRNEYMKQNNLADFDDFKGTWERSRKEREAFFKNAPDKKRREDVGRAIYQLEQRRGR